MIHTSSPTAQSSTDQRWMDRALELAGKGVGLASPNPTVGCVLVNDRQTLIGEGFHAYEERDHAEVVALRQAAGGARGATAYVTLEPCNHHGRTGPCADALIAAGVARVVIATLDANPVVRGNGVDRLRSAGVLVEVGLGRQTAQRLNDGFAKVIRTGLPWITLKSALSLDGRIAPAASQRAAAEPFWLTGEAARAEVHRLRHAHDALMTGIHTVLADDPRLTDRSGLARRLPLQRIVLDSQLRLPPTAKLLRPPDGGDVLVFTASHDTQRAEALRAQGATVEVIERGDFGLSLPAIMARLGNRGITSLWIEAGTGLSTSALKAGLVDRLVLFYAPLLLGPDALPFVDTSVILQPAMDSESTWFGPDLCVSQTLNTYWD